MRGMIFVLMQGCWLEPVTGESVPLDPDFYESVEAAQGQPGVGGGTSVPFSSHDGPMIAVRGVITSALGDPVDIDLRTPDPTQEGGVKGHGKVLLEEPGAFELQVPKGLGVLELQAFQDAGGDGPTPDDPFAQAEVTVGDSDVGGVEMTLEVGAHGTGGPVHSEAAPGAPGGGPGGGAAGDASDPFGKTTGARVTLRGTLEWDGPERIDVDLFAPDDAVAGGRRMLGKLMRAAGPYELSVPANFGPLIIEAFIDINQNGPGPGDPMGRYEGNPAVVGQSDLSGIDITLAVPSDGRMPMGDPAPPPNDAKPELR